MDIVTGFHGRVERSSALKRATQEARLRDARLVIVHGVGQRLSENPATTAHWPDEVKEAERRGEQVVAELEREGVHAIFRLEPTATSPAQALLNVARELEAGLVVIGIRRRTRVGKLVIGSVGQEVLLGAECPVLAVHIE